MFTTNKSVYLNLNSTQYMPVLPVFMHVAHSPASTVYKWDEEANCYCNSYANCGSCLFSLLMKVNKQKYYIDIVLYKCISDFLLLMNMFSINGNWRPDIFCET